VHGDSGVIDRRLGSAHAIEDLDVHEHFKAMMRMCFRLAAFQEGYAYGDLRLHKWAHMLGFRGHFLTKSRGYSVTFKRLRGIRADFQRARHAEENGYEFESTVVVGSWEYVSHGYESDAQRELAGAIASKYLVGENDSPHINNHD
jgi:hypothetical protein